MGDESVRVAVRVRPFNSRSAACTNEEQKRHFFKLICSFLVSFRENERAAKVCIKMEGNTTIIWDVNDEEKTRRKFAFDYSYWSHSGFHADSTGLLIPDDDKYACFDCIHS